MVYKKTYDVKELSCPECASHIIENLEKLNYVDEVHIDYDNKKITIIGKKALSNDQINKVISDILCKKHHDDDNFGRFHNVVTEEFKIDDIHCEHCATDMENELNKQNDIIDAEVSFINKKIIIKHLNNVEVYDIVSKIVSKNKKNIHEEEHYSHDSHGACECCHHHEHSENVILKRINRILLIAGAILCVLALLLEHVFDLEIHSTVCFYISFAFIGYDIIFDSIKGIIHGDIFNENFLMVVASLGSILNGDPFEGIMVMLLFKIGEYLQEKAVDKSKRNIQTLYELKSDFVTLENGEKKDIKDVSVGEVITVKVGEKIPLDGKIIGTGTNVDMKALTGESIPVYVDDGEEILSGSINLSKVVRIEVTKDDNESCVNKMLKLVDEANNQKSKAEEFITRFARLYTPIVLLIALFVGCIQFFVLKYSMHDTLSFVFTILVISCPCALVISIPLVYFGGIGKLSSIGVLVKGGNYLDIINKTKTFVFDKTGTLTKGNFKLTEIYPANGKTKDEVLNRIMEAEKYSTHPIAEAISKEYSIDSDMDNIEIEELPGLGLKLHKRNNDNTIDEILVGNVRLMKKYNIEYDKVDAIGTILNLVVNNEYYGCVCIQDEIKENASSVIKSLNEFADTVLLSGDKAIVANYVGEKVGVKYVESELFPKQKFERIKTIMANSKGKLTYIGDGINDAPALRVSDCGIAMGAVGSDQAKETADIVIMNDDLSKINDTVKVSRFTHKLMIENVIFALLVKVVVFIIAALHLLDAYAEVLGIFADVGVCLLAILNSLRVMKIK